MATIENAAQTYFVRMRRNYVTQTKSTAANKENFNFAKDQ